MTRPSDLAFSETVKSIQSRKGSRGLYDGAEWRTELDANLTAFVENMRSIFMATVNADGQPYIQHRGGPRGFLHVLDSKTIAFADFKGNRQYITQGNLSDNPRSFLFLMDYLNAQRVKIWGQAEVVEDDADLLARLMPDRTEYRALPEQVIKFHIDTLDINCPQHIPKRIDAEDFARVVQEKDARIAALEAQLAERG